MKDWDKKSDTSKRKTIFNYLYKKNSYITKGTVEELTIEDLKEPVEYRTTINDQITGMKFEVKKYKSTGIV